MDKHDVTLVNDDFTNVTLPQARLIAALDSDPAPRAGPPRIIISLDATTSMGEYLASRKLTLEAARHIVLPMFENARAAGLEVQLVYFRGDDQRADQPRECRASKWFRDPEELARAMAAVEHWPGWTQHNRVLQHVLRQAEKGPVHELVIITDAFEQRGLRRPDGDSLDEVCMDAMRQRRLGTKITAAYKGTIRGGCPLDRAGVSAEQAFRMIAEDNNGACFLYKPGDPNITKQFGELAAHAALQAQGDAAGAQVLLANLQSVPFEMDPVGEQVPSDRCATE